MIRDATPKKLGLIALIAATYCMVAGGPFGLEDLVQKSGYLGSIVILLATALFWAMPTTLMVSELSSALPKEGGFYAWVERAMGPFWGFQEGWLTFAGSIFDMAIYPTLFVAYLVQIWPTLESGSTPIFIGVVMIAVCAIWNLRGAASVGNGSIAFTLLFLAPFLLIVILALRHHGSAPSETHQLIHLDFLGGILIAMWNFMGWDNASTIAEEVHNPQRTYPLAMIGATALVILTYVIPIAAVSLCGIDPNIWSTGSWVEIGRILGGPTLAIAVMLAGSVAAVSTFNALVLSLSRLPLAMAEDGFLPKVFAIKNSKDVPWLAILVCSVIWGFCLKLGFEKVVMLDVLLTGLSILLEFAALVFLRIREPNLPRPFRVSGGTMGAVLCGVGPVALIVIAIIRNHAEKIGSVNALTIGTLIILIGPILYVLNRRLKLKSAR